MTDADASAADPNAHADAERRRRQAPQYGEYATPEEVAELRGPDAPPLVPAEPTPPPPPLGRPLPGPPPAGHRRAPGWDGILTVGLLAFGAYNVLSGVTGFFDLRAFLGQVARANGATDYVAPAGIQPLGYALAAAWVVLFVIAVVWSLRRMRHGRVAFWVPLLTGVVALTTTGVVSAIVLYATSAGAALQNQT